MIGSRISLSTTLTFLLFLLLISSCKLNTAEELIEHKYPKQDGEVLENGKTPSLLFTRDMDRPSVESALSLQGTYGEIPGRWEWDGRRVSFDIYGKFTHGEKYYISLDGPVRDKRGEIHSMSFSFSFYAGSDSTEQVRVLSTQPKAGGDLSSPHSPITIEFSTTMKRDSLKEAVSLGPHVPYELKWSDEDTVCILTPTEKGWISSRIYSLSIAPSARSVEGKSAESTFEALFRTDFERGILEAPEISTVRIEWPAPFPLISSDLTTLEKGETFRISFSRAVERDSIESAFTLEPLRYGRLYWVDEKSFVFLPEEGEFFEEDLHYTIDISVTAEAEDGSRLSSPFTYTFDGAAPSPRPIALSGSLSDPPIALPHNSSIPVEAVGAAASSTFIWEFDAEVSSSTLKADLQRAVRISPLFPPDLSLPRIVSFLWSDDRTLVCQVEGIGDGAAGRTCYYRVHLPHAPSARTDEEENTVILEYVP